MSFVEKSKRKQDDLNESESRLSKSKGKNSPTSLMAQKHSSTEKTILWVARHKQSAPRAPSTNQGIITEELESHKKTQPCKTQGRTIINPQFNNIMFKSHHMYALQSTH
jgi:hypothetical protein